MTSGPATQSAIHPAPVGGQSSSRRRGSRSYDESTQFLLPIYLREMGETPLLQDDEQLEHARRMRESRESIASSLRRLPARLRSELLDRGPMEGEGADWPLEALESFFVKLRSRARAEPAFSRLLADLEKQKDGLDRSRDALVKANLRLVVHVARQHANRGVPFIDLVQEGNIGLMKAVEKFDHRRGNKFSTYAFWWIKQAVDRSIAEKGRIIRIPVHLTELQKKIRRTIAELSKPLQRQPSIEEIAARMRLPDEKVRDALMAAEDAMHIEATADDHSGPMTLPDRASPTPLESMEQAELHRRLEGALSALDAREQEIVRLRFGVRREGAHTLEEIGRKLGLSRERVRQLEGLALRKLRNSEILTELFDSLGGS